MKKLPLFITAFAALLFVGCASTKQFVPMPDQSKTLDDPSKGRIYVMRPATVGSAITMQVSDGGKLIGETGPHGYLCWERNAGETMITSASEGASSAPLSVRQGGVYYLFQHLRMGIWIARSELEVVSAEEGQKVLKKCKPAKVVAPRHAPVQVSRADGGS